MTSIEMRFFWLLLLMMKCNGVPFTHICEWKRHSFFWLIWFTRLELGGSNGGTGFAFNDPSSHLGFYLRVRICI
jgi:hypothetical protein